MLVKYFIILAISFLPFVEIRMAIPVGLAMELPLLNVFLIGVIGNILSVPVVYFFARRVLVWGSDKPMIGKFFSFCLKKGEVRGVKIQENGKMGLFLALILFVGIPFPGTGAWTGTLAASIFKIKFRTTLFACMIGIVVAGIIISFASTGAIQAFTFFL